MPQRRRLMMSRPGAGLHADVSDSPEECDKQKSDYRYNTKHTKTVCLDKKTLTTKHALIASFSTRWYC